MHHCECSPGEPLCQGEPHLWLLEAGLLFSLDDFPTPLQSLFQSTAASRLDSCSRLLTFPPASSCLRWGRQLQRGQRPVVNLGALWVGQTLY